eukprot:TRINITY_DN175_c2_g1_i1.p1 TRINITY_DN175_c2_g1~~TRINITY_DN175_c2_g1_i1.p1  ORF type:complete len:378 (+),score=74.57 TRINITY_DN175_c2_g1_i1:418-1551(+)
MSDDYNMLGNLGVQIPHKIVRLSKGPNDFIRDGGGPLAQHIAGRGSERRLERKGSWRSDWRPHAEPMQRSHFSTSHPSSMQLDNDMQPVSKMAPEMTHHRKLSKHTEQQFEHPLESYKFENKHKQQRTALKPMNVNSIAAAGAPSRKVTRPSIQGDVTRDINNAAEAAEVSHRRYYESHQPREKRIWTAERDRKEREKERLVIGKEHVLSASSPPRERPEDQIGNPTMHYDPNQRFQTFEVPPPQRLWTAERGRKEAAKQQVEATPRNHTLQHAHKKLWEPENYCSPLRQGQIGVQKSALQKQLQSAGWWEAQSSPNEVRTQLELLPQSPSMKQPYFGLPNHSRTLYETADPKTRRATSTHNITRSSSRSTAARKWK